jgi:hypothetical protein
MPNLLHGGKGPGMIRGFYYAKMQLHTLAMQNDAIKVKEMKRNKSKIY